MHYLNAFMITAVMITAMVTMAAAEERVISAPGAIGCKTTFYLRDVALAGGHAKLARSEIQQRLRHSL